MESMYDVAQVAFAQMPPECRLTAAHAQLIKEYEAPLLALEAEVVKAFYDTVYGHSATAAVFVDGERPDREVTLANWWRRTVIGPLDEHYFAWMAMVGLVHVSRKVTNPMMHAMADFVSTFVAEKVATMQLERDKAEALVEAFHRLSMTVGSIITFGYDRAYDRAVVTALFDVAGMPEALFHRLRDQEIAAALERARSDRPGGR